jgi:hypothetical protein
MGTISVNKLGGLALVVGPIIGLISYLIRPGGGIVGGSVDPTNAKAAIGALIANADLANISLFLGPIGAILLLFGIQSLVKNVLKGGNGEALGSLGTLMILFVVIAWVITAGLSQSIAGQSAGAATGALYAATLAIQVSVGIIGAIGFLLVTLAASTNDFFNKNFTLGAALAAAVGLVAALVGGFDLSLLYTMNYVSGIAWLVLTVWSITVGLSLMKKA